MRIEVYLLVALSLAGCRTAVPVASTQPEARPIEQLRTPRMHQLDITFRSLEDIRIAAYRYNYLRFEIGPDLQADPPRHLVGIWCTDEELPGFIEKMRADNLFFKVTETQ